MIVEGKRVKTDENGKNWSMRSSKQGFSMFFSKNPSIRASKPCWETIFKSNKQATSKRVFVSTCVQSVGQSWGFSSAGWKQPQPAGIEIFWQSILWNIWTKKHPILWNVLTIKTLPILWPKKLPRLGRVLPPARFEPLLHQQRDLEIPLSGCFSPELIVDRPTQLICIFNIYLLTDKYERHSRAICY